MVDFKKKLVQERQEKTVVSNVEGIVKHIAEEVAPIVKKAMALVIRTDDDYKVAGGFLKTVKGFLQQIEEGEIGVIDKSTKEARQAAIALRKIAEAPLLETEGILKPKIAVYLRQEQERKAREDREKREAAERETRERAENERLELAQKLMDEGREDEAADVIERELKPNVVVIPEASRPVVKVDGVSVRRTYSARVTDFGKLVEAIGSNGVPLDVAIANMPFLNAQARAFKDTAKLGYPGVEVVAEDGVASTK